MRPARALARAGAATALIALLGGCGGGLLPPDLFIVYRSGSVPGARLTLIIDDQGGVRCNGSRAQPISDSQLLSARAIQEELHDPATRHMALAARPGSVLRYYLRDQDGTVSFADNSAGAPSALHRLALLVEEVAQRQCRLAA